MPYIEFGKDNQKASEIIIGLMRISKMTLAEVKNLIDASLDVGINFLDIADCYAKGKCEEILGEVFAANPGLRDKVILQTKCGIRIDDDFTWFDFSKEHILEAADASLKRMKVDSVDCLLLHRPDALTEPDEIAEAFTELHDAGKVKNFGVSNMNPIMMERLRAVVPFPIVTNQVQLSCAFTPSLNAGFNVNMENDHAIMRDGGILEYCQSNGIVIQARVKESAAATDVTLSKKEWYEIYLSAGNVLP